jgi:serine/threonine-protein kinase
MTQGAERVSRDLANRPDVQAALMDAIGEVEGGLGRYDRAEPLLQRSLGLRRSIFGPSSVEFADSLEHLGRLKQARSAFAESEKLLRRALAIKRSRLGDRRLETAKTCNALGELLVTKGEPAEAEKLHREALAIATRVEKVGPTVAESLLLLAKAKKEQGNLSAAERLARQGLIVERQVLGPQDPSLYRVQTDVGEVLLDAGKFKEAEFLLRASLQAQQRILGREHPDVAVTKGDLATALYRQGRWAEAEAANREALAIVRSQFGPSHWLMDAILGDLASAIDAQGRPGEAIRYEQEVLEIRRRNYGPESAQVAQTLLLLAGAHRRLQQYPQAITLASEGLDILEKLHDHHVAFALREIGRDYQYQGNPAEAEPYLRRALAIRRQELSKDHPDLATVELTLADCLVDLGRYPEAAALLREARAILRPQADANKDRIGELLFVEAKLQGRQGKAAG